MSVMWVSKQTAVISTVMQFKTQLSTVESVNISTNVAIY